MWKASLWMNIIKSDIVLKIGLYDSCIIILSAVDSSRQIIPIDRMVRVKLKDK